MKYSRVFVAACISSASIASAAPVAHSTSTPSSDTVILSTSDLNPRSLSDEFENFSRRDVVDNELEVRGAGLSKLLVGSEVDDPKETTSSREETTPTTTSSSTSDVPQMLPVSVGDPTRNLQAQTPHAKHTERPQEQEQTITTPRTVNSGDITSGSTDQLPPIGQAHGPQSKESEDTSSPQLAYEPAGGQKKLSRVAIPVLKVAGRRHKPRRPLKEKVTSDVETGRTGLGPVSMGRARTVRKVKFSR